MSARFAARLSEAKIWAGSKIQIWGATLYRWALDLSFVIEPRLSARPLFSRPNPWPAVGVTTLLALGLATSGYLAVEAVHFIVGLSHGVD